MSPDPMDAWWATSASLRGSSHGADGPNQDAVARGKAVSAGDAQALIAVVADGHGGVRYVRSQDGARFAVDVTLQVLADRIAGTREIDLTQVLRSAAPAVVDAWRAAVLGHLAGHPFTDEEATRAGAPLYDNPLVAYGATLLIAVVTEAGVALAQLGDGDALVRTHGYAVRPVPGDDRLVANETTSLCLDTAVADFRFAELPDSAEVDLVLLATDGYGNSFAATDWWHTLVGDLAWYIDVHGFPEFEAKLPEWLAESARVGGDDVTAAVLARRLEVPVPAPVPVAPPAPVAEASAPLAPVAPRPRAPRRALAAALVAGLAAGAAIVGGLFVLASGDPDEPGGPVSPTRTTAPAQTLSTPSPTPKATPTKTPPPSPTTKRTPPTPTVTPTRVPSRTPSATPTRTGATKTPSPTR